VSDLRLTLVYVILFCPLIFLVNPKFDVDFLWLCELHEACYYVVYYDCCLVSCWSACFVTWWLACLILWDCRFGPWYTSTHGYQWGGVWKGFWVLAICVVIVFVVMLVPYSQWARLFNSDTGMGFVVLGLVWTNTTLDQFDPCSFCVELISRRPEFVPVRNSSFTSWVGHSNGLLSKGYYLCWLVLCMATA
jgi:hypothetical protein